MSATELRRWSALLLLGLLLMVAWDLSGADLWVTRQFGSPTGFPWRDRWLTRDILHDAGRWLSVGVLLLLAWDAWRPLVDGPPRAQRAYGVAVVLACAVAVPELRRMSATSCPWDLTEFGGTARYVSHWALVAIDSGPGRCFPSGHAVSGFALCGAVHAWRTHRPAWARAGLSIALALGLLFGITQVLRGAHYVSHVLWSGWLCLLITTVAAALEPRVLARQRA